MRVDLNRFRPFISVWVLFTSVVITLSGFVLYLHVRTLGSPALWKHTHVWLSFAFLAGAAFHLALNWKAMMRHFTGSVKSMQWALATALCALLLAVVIFTGGREEERHGPQERGRMEAAGPNRRDGAGQAQAIPAKFNRRLPGEGKQGREEEL